MKLYGGAGGDEQSRGEETEKQLPQTDLRTIKRSYSKMTTLLFYFYALRHFQWPADTFSVKISILTSLKTTIYNLNKCRAGEMFHKTVKMFRKTNILLH